MLALAGMDNAYKGDNIPCGDFLYAHIKSTIAHNEARFTKPFRPGKRNLDYLRKRAEKFMVDPPPFIRHRGAKPPDIRGFCAKMQRRASPSYQSIYSEQAPSPPWARPPTRTWANPRTVARTEPISSGQKGNKSGKGRGLSGSHGKGRGRALNPRSALLLNSHRPSPKGKGKGKSKG